MNLKAATISGGIQDQGRASPRGEGKASQNREMTKATPASVQVLAVEDVLDQVHHPQASVHRLPLQRPERRRLCPAVPPHQRSFGPLDQLAVLQVLLQ